MERLLLEQADLQGKVAVLAAEAGDALPEWVRDYESQSGQKPFEQLRENYERRRKAN